MKLLCLILGIILLFIIYYAYCIKKPTANNLHISQKLIDKYYTHDVKPNIYKPINNNRIFVSIASYRDPQLIETYSSMIFNCDNVENLTVVICEQNDPIDKFTIDKIIDNKCIPKFISMNSKDARGPCWARYLIQQEWKGEEYYLQIDSHTRFVKGWDTKLINDLATLPEKSCLSNYVSTYDIKTGKVEKSPLRGPMYVSEINKKDNFVRFNSKYINKPSFSKPQPSKGWSGCFSFSKAQIILDAPYDPYTPFLFFGEEMDIYARLYSRGWKMFVPSIPICFTLFDRSYRKTYWEHPEYKQIVNYSRARIYNRFGWLKVPKYLRLENDTYGLGKLSMTKVLKSMLH